MTFHVYFPKFAPWADLTLNKSIFHPKHSYHRFVSFIIIIISGYTHTGLAIKTGFRVTCTQWMDEGNNLARPLPGEDFQEAYLQYRVLQRPKGTTIYSLMYSSEDSTIQNLVFGVGPAEYNNTIEMKVQIADKYGAKADTTMDIQVRLF